MRRRRLAAGSAALIRASREAHTGVDALVPPLSLGSPPNTSEYNGGPANAATSGTIRPLNDLSADGGLMEAMSTVCQDGRGKSPLTPPPVAPPSVLRARHPGGMFQTTSSKENGLSGCFGADNIVPPTDST